MSTANPTEARPAGAAPNPFSTRHTRPGALPYLFRDETQADVAALVDQLESEHGLGQICGDHGTGKSTLLVDLQRQLEARGRVVVRLPFPPSRWLATLWAARAGRAIVVVDGFERLSGFVRTPIVALAQMIGSGLLVTCHRRCRLPLLWHTHVSLVTATAIVERLTVSDPRAREMALQDLERRLRRHGGDMRETLFELYDVCQRQAL